MYGFLRTREKEPTFNIVKFYARRYLRLTPALIATILCDISIIRLMGSGPGFQLRIDRLVDTCEKNWWLSLLYVSNYVDVRNICLPQSWYLSADTQLYWLSPLLLLPVVWWKKCSYYLFGIITIVGTAVVWFIVYDKQLIPNAKPSDYLSAYHTATHTRICPWVIGHALAYFIYQNRNKKFNIPMWLATLLWVLALSLGAYSMFGMYPITELDYEYDRAYVSYFMAMSTVFYCLAISWIIFSCIFGYGGIVNWFLSLPMWQPLSRLTYSMYITHFTLQLALHAGVKTPIWFSKMHLVCVTKSVSTTIQSVQINYVRVPQAVRNNSGRPVVLDCDYTVRPTDEGLVIKWFLNGAPAAVYQWIPPKRPQSLGPLRDRLDLTYKVTDDPNTMHRALRILNPTTDISGEYKCFVSTFNDEDFSARHMTVFEPEQRLLLYQSVPQRGQVNISCSVTAVYPEPQIALFKDPDRKDRKPIKDVEVWSRIRDRDGRYDVTALATLPESELEPAESVFDCEMTIPGTGYTKRTSRVYYPEGSEFKDSQHKSQPAVNLLVYSSLGIFGWFVAQYYCALLLL
ncbi:nose resistant to fluoxetine protein 6-like [Chrysoperla carnea]|uniref:nose resistant to fluoxetine protein 6-like n=1 Tax=Chrysoperla carnea TaxID=189513 RepID=UPI001D08FB44|nr:nose resistant to fluoxetine protein 6-like [Chrysoperla carnea]